MSVSAAIADLLRLRVKRLSGSSGLSGLFSSSSWFFQPNKRDKPNRPEQPARSHGLSSRTVMSNAG
jgi:hypothetical protein